MSGKFEILEDDDATVPADITGTLLKSLGDAKRHISGEIVEGVRIHHIEIPEPDVSSIRKKTGLSQSEFARSISVALSTLQNWEQGRRRPHGPARVLLALIDKDPNIVQKALVP